MHQMRSNYFTTFHCFCFAAVYAIPHFVLADINFFQILLFLIKICWLWVLWCNHELFEEENKNNRTFIVEWVIFASMHVYLNKAKPHFSTHSTFELSRCIVRGDNLRFNLINELKKKTTTTIINTQDKCTYIVSLWLMKQRSKLKLKQITSSFCLIVLLCTTLILFWTKKFSSSSFQ